MIPIKERIELISFRLCPFVMRTQITGLEKGVEFKTTYIDLQNKPKWFLEQSPTGAVPAVKIDGYFIFESAVICDLIDELTSGTLYPADPLEKFHNKSWINFASDLLFKQFASFTALEEAEFEEKVGEMLALMQVLENKISDKPFWNGEQFGIIDASYAPLLHRFQLINEEFNIDYLLEFPKIKYWTDSILKKDSVQRICNDKFESEYLSYLAKQKAYLASAA